MEKPEYLKHFELEQEYWWFVGRRAIVFDQIRTLGLDRKALLLDAGCGTGINLQAAQPLGTAVGCDFEPQALQFCRRRGLRRLLRADINHLPFVDQSFDLVLLLDVLSHRSIPSDISVLLEVRRILKKGGFLLVADSAFPFLWSRHDLAFHVRERYTRRTLAEKTIRAGLTVRKTSYFQFFFFLPLVVLRIWERIQSQDDQPPSSNLKPLNRKINAWMARIFRLESFLLRYVRLPFGSSLLLLAEKSGDRRIP